MRVIDLSAPIHEGMATGLCYAQERPFEIESIMSWDDGIRLDHFHVYCEQGTRLMLYSADGARRDGPKIDESNIILQDMVIADIPKGPNEVVTAQEIESAAAKVDFREGDAILFRTGWGDRYRELGLDYELKGPHFGLDETFKKIWEILTAKKSKLFCYDTANCSDMNVTYKDWIEQKPRPKTWPSPEAKAFMKKRAEARRTMKIPEEGVGLLRLFRARINMLGGLVNCGEIKKERVKIIALPLKVQGVGIAPCNVVAIEE